MANQEVIVGGKTIQLVAPKRDLTPTTRLAGGKYRKSSQGPVPLIGDMEHGWFGTVLPADFISGPDLAIAIGLSAGFAFNSTVPWLKFSHLGKILYVAKRPLRYALSWNQINSLGAVFGTATVVIGEATYKVRLPRGASTDPALNQTTADAPTTHGSEWNRLMYHVAATLPAGNSEGIATGDFAQYTSADLGVESGNGVINMCQEVHPDTSGRRLGRGAGSVAGVRRDVTLTGTFAVYGWRPVLELVE